MKVIITKPSVKFGELNCWDTFVVGSVAYLKIPAIGFSGAQFNTINLNNNQFVYSEEFAVVDPRSHEFVIK